MGATGTAVPLPAPLIETIKAGGDTMQTDGCRVIDALTLSTSLDMLAQSRSIEDFAGGSWSGSGGHEGGQNLSVNVQGHPVERSMVVNA